MAVDQRWHRIEALETKIVEMATELDLRTKEIAYMYIHSNWTLVC